MITFQYQNLAVTLRSPELGDTQDIILGVQRKLDMAGKQHTFVPPIRSSRRLSLVFKNMQREKYLELRDFLIIAMGKVVQYIDFKDQKWEGRISTDAPTYASEGSRSYSMSLQFEGRLIA